MCVLSNIYQFVSCFWWIYDPSLNLRNIYLKVEKNPQVQNEDVSANMFYSTHVKLEVHGPNLALINILSAPPRWYFKSQIIVLLLVLLKSTEHIYLVWILHDSWLTLKPEKLLDFSVIFDCVVESKKEHEMGPISLPLMNLQPRKGVGYLVFGNILTKTGLWLGQSL